MARRGPAKLAEVIQTALRANAQTDAINVKWNGVGRFAVYLTNGGSLGAMTAAGSGTDLSAAGYMNGIGGALSGCLLVDAVLRPQINATALPAWMMDRYGDAIMAGAIAHLAGLPGLPWSNPLLSAAKAVEYNQGVGSALVDIEYGNTEDYATGIGA